MGFFARYLHGTTTSHMQLTLDHQVNELAYQAISD